MRTTQLLAALALPLALALAACGGSDKTPAAAASTTPAAAGGAASDPTATCEAFFTRARECTDDYLPALLDVRIELDKPAGIAESARTSGRDALLQQAHTEWETDSQPAAITQTCQQAVAQTPPAQLDGMRAGAQQCLEAATCGEFATCSKDLHRAMMGGS